VVGVWVDVAAAAAAAAPAAAPAAAAAANGGDDDDDDGDPGAGPSWSPLSSDSIAANTALTGTPQRRAVTWVGLWVCGFIELGLGIGLGLGLGVGDDTLL